MTTQLMRELAEAAVATLSAGHWVIADAAEHVPGRPGLYAIYGDDQAWQDLQLEPSPGAPLYVGKAEKSLASRDLNGHFATNVKSAPRTGRSTVRRSFAARQLADLLAERGAVSDITTDDILDVFLTDARDYEAGPAEPISTRAVFDILENADGSVTFSVFFKDSVYRVSGLSSTSVTRHTCGTLTGTFAERALSIGDLDCPPELAEYAGDDSIFVPMTQNAEKFGVEINTVP